MHARLLPVLLSVFVLAAAACGGEESAPPVPASTTVQATSTAAASSTASPSPAARAEVTVTATATATTTRTPAPSPSPAATPTTRAPAPATALAETPPRVALEPAFPQTFFERPVDLGPYPGGRVFVAEQDGRVLLLTPGQAGSSVLLDLSGRVLRSGNEEGLLSVALDPGFASNGFVYAYYSAGGPRRSVLGRFTVPPGTDAASEGSELVVLEVAQPFRNHNGGAVRFGPDGMLYLGLGDGGSGGDPLGNGQDPSTLLGTVIRIDVRGAAAAEPYAVPADNPTFDPALNARPEVWAYGLRNPWRMAFDSATGALWLADVGQNAIEEIDVVTAGGNYGWNRLEGDACYSPRSGCERPGMTGPVATYAHADGCSVSGGTVYRGSATPSLVGWYVYGDFCSGTVWGLPSDGSGGPVVLVETDTNISSFGVDGDGELYMLDFGVIFRFVEVE